MLLARTDKINDGIDLIVIQKSTLASHQRACPRRQKQHVTVSEQFVCTHFVQDNATVRTAGDLKSNSCGQVGLNQPRDDIHGRLLGGQNQVDAYGAAFLSETDNVLLDFLSGGHHEVCQFVGHNDNEWQVKGNRFLFVFACWFQPLHQLLFAQLVVDADVSHTSSGQQFVTFFHFLNSPGQNCLGFTHIGHHGMHQVRQGFIATQFDHFRVNHQHANFIGSAHH